MSFLSKLCKYFWCPGVICKSRSSIYRQVVIVITLLSICLFLAFGVIFRSVNELYMKNVIQETGNKIGHLVKGALYHSMLKNDKTTLQNTLDIIQDMPTIDEVSMYDENEDLVYSSIRQNEKSSFNFNPNCKLCHEHFSTLFPPETKSYKILKHGSSCGMNKEDCDHRHLLIHTPILNEPSCYTNQCHVHTKEDKILGSLVVNIPLDNLDSALEDSTADFFILATIMTALLLTALLIITRRKIRRPLAEIVKVSEVVANGDFSKRLIELPHQLDDIRMVSGAFNNMLDKINKVNLELQNWSQQLEYKVQKKTEELNEAQNELVKVERMASLGRLSSSVAHELNNPLAGVLTYAKLISKKLNNPNYNDEKKEQILKYLKTIENETKRCGDIVKGLLDFSRKDQQGFEEKGLHKILSETSDLMSNQMKIADIDFHTDFNAKQDKIQCIPNQIKQACIAIIQNAIEAIGQNGEIIMSTHNPDQKTIRLEITDNGPGISPDDLPHVFEPFFSAKNKTSGIGLGLAIVHGIIQSHKGKIKAKSTKGQGTTIAIIFTLVQD